MHYLKNWPQILKWYVLKQLCRSTKNSFKSRSRRSAMICSKPPLNSDLIFLDQFPPKNCRWLRTLFSHSTRLLILWRGLILTGYFQSKACPKASHTKPMLLTSSWCSHENMNQGILLLFETCKFRHLHVLWMELQKIQPRQTPEPGENSLAWSSEATPGSSRSPHLAAQLFTVCDHGSTTKHPPKPNLTFRARAEIYLLYWNRTLWAFQSLKLQEIKHALSNTLINSSAFFKVDLKSRVSTSVIVLVGY